MNAIAKMFFENSLKTRVLSKSNVFPEAIDHIDLH